MRRFIDFYTAHRDDLDALIFDVDGTLVSGRTLIPEAKELLERLREDKFPYFLLTNDACNSCERKAEIISATGLQITPEQIISSGNALEEYIRVHNLAGKKFYQCGSLGEPSYAEKAGLTVTRDPREIGVCEGVVMGEGKYDWFSEVNGLFNFLLRNPDAPLLVSNPDSYWPHPGGMGVGAGGMCRFICGLVKEAGFDVTPTYLGKPYAPIYEYVLKRLPEMVPTCPNPAPERIAMIGDSLVSDIQGGNGAGMLTCLVLTGITSRELADNAPLHRKPAEIFDTL